MAAGEHKEGKKLAGTYLDEPQFDKLRQTAEILGMNVSDTLKRAIENLARQVGVTGDDQV